MSDVKTRHLSRVAPGTEDDSFTRAPTPENTEFLDSGYSNIQEMIVRQVADVIASSVLVLMTTVC